MKKAGIILFFKVFGAISNLILGFLIARNFGEAAYAEFSIILTLISLGLIFCNWGGANFIIQENKENKFPYFYQIFFLNLLFSGLYIYIIYVLRGFFNLNYFVYYIFSIIFYTFFLTKSSIYILNNRQIINSFIDDFLKNFLLMISFLGLILVGVKSLDKIIFLYIFLLIIVSIYILIDFWKNYKLPKNKLKSKDFFKNGFFVSTTLVIILLLSQLDRFFINYYLSSVELARYFLCYSLMITSSFFSQSLISLYLPSIIKSIKHKENNTLEIVSRKYSRIIVLITILQIFVLNLFLKSIFKLYKIDFDFHNYIILNILLFGNLIATFFGLGMTVASYTDDKKNLAKRQLLVFIIHVPLLIICIPYFGIVGAAIIYSFSQILIKFLMYRFYILKNINFFICKF